jgi:hypothetical protein
MSSRLLVVPDPTERATAARRREELAAALPDGVADVPPKTETAWSRQSSGVVEVQLAWPKGYVDGVYDAGYGGVVLAPELARDPEELRLAWREWLGFFNELQVLPNTFLMTRDGVAHGDYVGLSRKVALEESGVASAAAMDVAWEGLISEALEDVRPGLRELAERGVLPPDAVGAELERDGLVQAEAELRWAEQRLVVLAVHQMDGAAAWHEAGWQVVPASDTKWVSKVADTLSREGVA